MSEYDDFREMLPPEIRERLFPDTNRLAMAVDGAKMELVRFIKGLSDEQLNMLERIMVPRNNKSNEEYLSVVTQIGGMLAYEQCMRDSEALTAKAADIG